jgi:uncharacterized protein involved in exopolysaccharide biosynthesis
MLIKHHAASLDEEFDVFDLSASVWRQRWLVGAVAAFFAVAAIVYALLATPLFRGEAVVVDVKEDNLGGLASLANEFGGIASMVGLNLTQGEASRNNKAVLQSRFLAETFIKRYVPLQQLFAHSREERTLWRGVREFRKNVLAIDEDTRTGKTTVSVEWTDADTAAKWANEYVALANELIRSRVQDESTRNIKYLNQQIEQSNDVELRRAMYSLIESETKRLMLANGRAEYAFSLVDPAVAPEIRASPRRTLIVLAATFCGLLLGCLVALGRDVLIRRRAAAAAA